MSNQKIDRKIAAAKKKVVLRRNQKSRLSVELKKARDLLVNISKRKDIEEIEKIKKELKV